MQKVDVNSVKVRTLYIKTSPLKKNLLLKPSKYIWGWKSEIIFLGSHQDHKGRS